MRLNKNEKEKVIEQYTQECKSSKEIAKEIGVHPSSITRFLRKVGIKITYQRKLRKILTKEFLYENYILNGKSANEISKELKCCISVIILRLREYNINVRKKSDRTERQKQRNREISLKRFSKKNEIGKCIEHPNYGKKFTKEQTIKRLISRGDWKGKNNPLYHKTWEQTYGKEIADRMRKENSNRMIKFMSLDKNRKFIGEVIRKNWKDPEFRKKVMSEEVLKKNIWIRNKKPSSFEKKISYLCKKYNLPFIYTGDGRLIINFKNPDFIDEKDKIIIEVFSNYYKIRDYGSVENYIKKRSETFAQKSYRTIFIQEEEIKNKDWEIICLNKINKYIKC